MGLTIDRPAKEESAMSLHTVTERLYETDAGDLVPDGHPDARWLAYVPGQQITAAEAAERGLAGDGDDADDSPAAVNAGSVDDVTRRVGDDRELVAAALEAEQAARRPRKTLIQALEAILAGDGDDAGDSPPVAQD